MSPAFARNTVGVLLFLFLMETRHLDAGDPPTPNWFYYWGQVLGTEDAAHYKYTDVNDGSYASTRVTSPTDWVITFRSLSNAANPVPPTGNKHINGFAAVVFHERWHRDHRIHNYVVHGARDMPFRPSADCDADGDGICNREPTDPPGFMDGGWEHIIGTNPRAVDSPERGAEWAELNATYGYENQDWSAPGSQKQALRVPFSEASDGEAKRVMAPEDHRSRLGGFTFSEAEALDRFLADLTSAMDEADGRRIGLMREVYRKAENGFHKVVFWERALRAGIAPELLLLDDDYSRMAELLLEDKEFDKAVIRQPVMKNFYGQWREWTRFEKESEAVLGPLSLEGALGAILETENPRAFAAHIPVFRRKFLATEVGAHERFFAVAEPLILEYSGYVADPRQKSFQGMRFHELCLLGLSISPERMGLILQRVPKDALNDYVKRDIQALEFWAAKGRRFPVDYDTLKIYHDNNLGCG